jgi:hypothetical protein
MVTVYSYSPSTENRRSFLFTSDLVTFSREVFESRRVAIDLNPGFSIDLFVSKTGCGQESPLKSRIAFFVSIQAPLCYLEGFFHKQTSYQAED